MLKKWRQMKSKSGKKQNELSKSVRSFLSIPIKKSISSDGKDMNNGQSSVLQIEFPPSFIFILRDSL